jgi:hypothetical protein
VFCSSAASAALDGADNTLWFAQGFDGTLYQYSLTGQFLGSVTYPDLAGADYLGGEFASRPPTGGR